MATQMPDPTIQIVKEANGIKVHQFTSPEMLLANSTYIIEGPKKLVVVDGQFVVPVAQGFRAYADSLGKPIDRVYLSHEHPDHFFGVSAAFGDVPVHALAETIDFLKANGEAIRADRAKVYGEWVPTSITIPSHTVTPGTEVIDGITIDTVVFRDCEVPVQLALRLPQLGLLITGDLIYSGCHVYVHKGVDGWISALQGLKASNYETFLPGHGPVADEDEIQANIDYLRAATKIAAETQDPEAYKAALLAAFPDRKAPGIIDIYAHALFA